MDGKEKFAKIIRMMTVPPVLATVMLLIGYLVHKEDFATVPVLGLNIFLLAIVPVLAYPIASIKKDEAKSIRERQRKLAFLLNLCGYLAAWLMGAATHCSKILMTVLSSYVIAVLLLSLLNKVLKVRASGHACSCVLPYLFMGNWLGAAAAGVCIILYIIEFWASVFLKRHTIKEFLMGSMTAVIAFGAVFIGDIFAGRI